ncbi:MAG: chromosomal replication initiator protein DnaA [Candidatus Sumerlaeota bacterium]|nr:chromosomal replication initiator protein DnaA [Candidatus Sumerlaeota bacterium]
MQESFDQQMWDKALARLKDLVDEESFATWLRPTRCHGAEGNRLLIAVPSPFFRNWLMANYRDRIVRTLRDLTSMPVDVDFVVTGNTGDGASSLLMDDIFPAHDTRSVTAQKPQGARAPTPLEFPRATYLNPKYTFETFVVGECNRFAHAASRQVAEPSSKSYNPLFIYGGVGLGKTHLMHAIGHKYSSAGQTLRVLYVTSEQFMNSFIEAISQGKQFEFRDFYRNIDLLMIDDVQFFSGKERTQTEFFHTFNALYDAGKKIVISSDRPPRELTTLEDRLRNRLSWGLLVDIQPPDLETRIAILKRKAMVDGIDIPNDVTVYIAERVTMNIRDLEGVLTRLRAYSALEKEPLALDMARAVLGNLIENEPRRSIDIDAIIEEVCQYFELRRVDLLGSSRVKRFSAPRHIAQYLARKLTTLSYPEIALKFGGRDHTSVLYAFRKIEGVMQHDENMKSLINYLNKRIRGARDSG